MSKQVPDLGKIDKEIERAEKQLLINRSGSLDFGPKERTFIMVKPDGVQRGLVGKIVQKFEERGFKLAGMKMARPPREAFEKHYQNLKATPHFNKVVEYMLQGPVCQMVWEGDNVIAISRMMLGETRPLESNPGTIRGDFGIDIGRNVCHGSDSVSSADREIDLWFRREELWARTTNLMT
jgi:nucleoside-diphosphate kinase